jgi:hypothetical protein
MPPMSIPPIPLLVIVAAAAAVPVAGGDKLILMEDVVMEDMSMAFHCASIS